MKKKDVLENNNWMRSSGRFNGVRHENSPRVHKNHGSFQPMQLLYRQAAPLSCIVPRFSQFGLGSSPEQDHSNSRREETTDS